MNLTQQDKRALSDVRWKKALEYLDDAGANLKDNRYGTSVNRSYYALLNAARALLVLEGANPQSHNGVMTLVNLRFVKTGLLSKTVIKNFRVLLTRRTDVDYGDFELIEESDAEDSWKLAEETIEQMEKLRKEILEGA